MYFLWEGTPGGLLSDLLKAGPVQDRTGMIRAVCSPIFKNPEA